MRPVSPHWVTMYPHIDEHLAYCKSRGFSTATTIPDRREVLERVIRDLGNLHTVTSPQIAGWLARAGWAPQTRATYFGHICGYLKWAQRNGLIIVNPMDLLDRPTVPPSTPRSTNHTAFGKIVREAVEPWLTAALLAGYAGLRCFEIAKGRREDVDEEWIRVLGKGGRCDELPTHSEIWMHVRGRPPGLLVRNTLGRQYPPSALSTLFAHYTRTHLGLRDATLHRLRHLYGNTLRTSRLADGGRVDMEVIRTLMRHTSLATTQRYLYARDEERRAAIRALPAVA